MSPTPAPARAGRREWIGLAVIALPCMLYSMDLTVLNLAVPALSRELAPSASQLLWIIDIYGFMVAGMLITMGTLGDRIGRRRLLLIGAAAFGVASVLAAFATSAEALIAMRALLGIAGATVAPSTLSLIRNMFHDPAQRTTAIGIWVSSYSLGAAVGPLIGGLLLEWFWWGSVFLINVPVMLLLLAVGPWLLPEFRDPAARRMDLPSAALSLAAVLAMIYGLKRLAEHGLALEPLLAIGTGLALGAVFVRRQRGLADPLIDLRLFRVPAFSASLAIYLLACLAMFGVYIFIAQYLQLVLGLTPLQAGVATVPWALAFVAGSMLTPVLLRRWSSAGVVAGGLLLAAAAFVMLSQAPVPVREGLPLMIVANVLMSLGLAPVFTLATDLVVGSVPPERAGAASAISETSSEFGGALGVAVFGSLGTAIYRGAMAESPAPLPPQALEAARATLGGAASAAGQLSGTDGALLLDASRAAFMQGLELSALAGAALLVAAALLAWSTLRAPPRTDAATLTGELPCDS